MNKASTLAMAAALALSTMPVLAQKTASQGIDEYRAMLQDGNPAALFEAKGESLWKQKRGPKNASLEQCDLGKGPGVVKGAWVELPRYFADTGRVQDLESRLLTCMQELQRSAKGATNPKDLSSMRFWHRMRLFAGLFMLLSPFGAETSYGHHCVVGRGRFREDP